MAPLKNAMGPTPWWSTALKPELDASQSMMNVLVKSDSCRTVADVSMFFNVSNVAAASSDQQKDSCLRSYVSSPVMSL
jgi:hypothetical protein